MDFEAFFTTELQSLHSEGRYRVFADIERQQATFPARQRYNAEASGRTLPSGAPTTTSHGPEPESHRKP